MLKWIMIFVVLQRCLCVSAGLGIFHSMSATIANVFFLFCFFNFTIASVVTRRWQINNEHA